MFGKFKKQGSKHVEAVQQAVAQLAGAPDDESAAASGRSLLSLVAEHAVTLRQLHDRQALPPLAQIVVTKVGATHSVTCSAFYLALWMPCGNAVLPCSACLRGLWPQADLLPHIHRSFSEFHLKLNPSAAPAGQRGGVGAASAGGAGDAEPGRSGAPGRAAGAAAGTGRRAGGGGGRARPAVGRAAARRPAAGRVCVPR